MKTIKFLMWIALVTGVYSCTVYNGVSYVDPIYSSHPDVVKKPAPVVEEPVYYDDIQDDTYSESYVDENGTTINNYYGTTYNSSYAGRINRFRRVNPGFGYFSPMYNPGWNFGFGFNSWGGSSFYMGYNSGFYDPFWDPFWSPFAYDPWFCPSPWGWNAWRPYSYWRPYYAPVYAYGDFYGPGNVRRNPARYGTIPRTRSGFGSDDGRRSNAPVGIYKSGSTNDRPTYNNRGTRSGAQSGTTRKNEPSKPSNQGVQRPTARPNSPSGTQRPTTKPSSPGVQRPMTRPSTPSGTQPSTRPTPPPRGRSYQPRTENVLDDNDRPANTVRNNNSGTRSVQRPQTQQRRSRSTYQRSSSPNRSGSSARPRSSNSGRSSGYSRSSGSSRSSYSRPSGGSSRSSSPARSSRSSRSSRPR
ncbi:hypothetical protein [Luteibaculum oceani]|uniref:Uncharacterized protein n=1 Tax=Luteibaculum oceani TaxID=1294296 RepID=A0A5C6VBE5_9FLAO|nr:hypothetical protein [Luteibaculum oceani]TXC81736.1 hypothetical protein FRX97_04260 [Luteibaculum oceani]